MGRRIGFFIATLLACGRGSLDPSVVWEPRAEAFACGPDGARAPYDRAVMKTTHNAYERDEPLFDQLVWHRIRSVELDVHLDKGGERAKDGAWFVYHADVPTMRSTSCTALADCLGQIAAYHDAVPKHEVLTVFLDLKDGFPRGHTPEDLDDAIVHTLGRDVLVTPRDLRERCPAATSLRDAVSGACSFPTLAELRGKVMLAVTGGSLCRGGTHVARYGREADARVAFLAPDVGDSCPFESYADRPEAILFNMDFDGRGRAVDVRRAGLVARVYFGGSTGGLDSEEDFRAARRSGAQLLATDKVNVMADPWASTISGRGFPFWYPGCNATSAEASALTSMTARSGDIGGARDSFYFAYAEDRAATTWSTFASVPSSHVDEEAKACLEARASVDADAAHVALCRPFDRAPPVMLVRDATGAATRAIPLDARRIHGLSAETPAFLRLALLPEDGATNVTAEASADGSIWEPVGKVRVASELTLRGVAVASHGDDEVRAVFGSLARDA
ncbi:MAG TPA: Ca2+-dependent phosphoinositide-specific phospholipase C, partial [Labilithrix sp.]